MHRPLAEDLAARGNRVITLDLLGHGHSDRPRDMWRYSMATYGEQVVALMDHLQIEQAVVMGTSLGANAALEIAAHHPERLRGLVIEMPVLDNGLLWSALTFTPLLVALTFGEPLMKLAGARHARCSPAPAAPLRQRHARPRAPGAGTRRRAAAGTVLRAHRAAARASARTFTAPTLVLGHQRDPVHPFSDAGMLAKEMPNARLLQANSLVELRLQPERLTGEIAAFLDEVWGRRCAPPKRQPQAHAGEAQAAKRAPAKRAAASAAQLGGNSSTSLTSTCPGAAAVPTADCGRLADPQRHERERLLGVAQLEAQVLLLDHLWGRSAASTRGR